MAAMLTCSQVAEILQCKVDRVRALIKSGKLVASNIGNSQVKPRFRIAPEAVDDFLRQTQVVPPAQPARRQRRNQDPDFVSYF